MNLLLASTLALGACGGSGEAAGLKYRVSDKELRGLTGDGVLNIETSKGEVTKLEDAYALGDLETQEKKKTIAATGTEKKAAGEAIEAAADRIEKTQDSQEGELSKVRSERDDKIAQAKLRYEEDTKRIRERYAAEQAANRRTLADAKTTQAVTAQQHLVVKTELAETKARQDLKKQEIMVAKAQLEAVKFDELLKMSGVVGPKETQRKINLDQQALNEQKKLIALQTRLQQTEAATQAERTKLDTLNNPTPAK